MARSRFGLARVLAVMGEAHDLDELEPFTPLVLNRFADSLGCWYASYYELDITTGDVPVYVRSAYEEALATWDSPTRIPQVDLARHRRLWHRSQDGVGAWSDVFTRSVRRSREIGRHEQRGLGHIDSLWMTFGDPRPSSRSCWMTLGQGRDFTQGQRETFLSSRRQVKSLIRHADARRRLADVMVALDTDADASASGMLLLGPSLRVERASPAARRIVMRWFGRLGSGLPEELADWLRSPFPREPLRVERGDERLVAETPTRGALILREEHLASGSLTAREREVLTLVADGMSTNEIGHALWVTPATVSKHLEHIYRKLGVTGRTAAVAAMRRTRTT